MVLRMFDAMVLAGGAARRMDGADKPALDVGGTSLLDRVLMAVSDAERVVVVGPERDVPREVVWCREEPAGGGPVAAIAAGLAHVAAPVVVVLAADLPSIAPAVPQLLRALHDAANADVAVRVEPDVAVLVDANGRVNYLAAAWRLDSLRRAVTLLGDPAGVSMRVLYAGTEMITVDDREGWAADCDTWDDLAAARSRAEQGSIE